MGSKRSLPDDLGQFLGSSPVEYLQNCAHQRQFDLSRPTDPVKFANSSIWTYCGHLLPLTTRFQPPTKPGSPAPSPPLSNRTSSPCSTPCTSSSLAEHNKHHYRLTIRASRPTPEFDAPRWHTDNYFFDPARSADTVGLWKLCATLKGPGTMFAVDGKGARGC